ncbi:MAG: NUDIX hydrolase, partial [Bacteroidetes bacterium]|nr:NUDIX hydrolase [Bacteroidota bacterium]
EEETGVKIEYLEQLYSFGKPDRDPRRRVVSVSYYALVKPDIYQLHATTDAEDVGWFDINKLPELAFDHRHILEMGLDRVRNKMTYEPIGFNLLDEKFAFADLLKLYEAIIGDNKKLIIDRANFKKKLKSLGIIEELPESRKQPGSGRPARLYRFNREQYFEKKNRGVFEMLFPHRS